MDYSQNPSYHNDCSALKYGFLLGDWVYNDGSSVAGCGYNRGHSGGVVGASLSDPTASLSHNYGPDDGYTTRCVSDFSFGSGYGGNSLCGGDDCYNINAHWWGAGNIYTHFFNPHGLFVR